MRKLLSLFFISFCLTDAAQNADSLKQLLKTTKVDTARLSLYALICEVCEENEIIDYAQPGIAVADKLLNSGAISEKERQDILSTKATLLNDMGIGSSGLGNSNDAIKYYKEGLKIEEQLSDKREIAVLQSNIGLIYKQQGNIPLALEYYHQAIKTFESLNDKNGVSVALNNIGLLYKQQGEVEKALEYYNKSLKLRHETNNKEGISATLGNIGYIYIDQRKFDKALECYNQSIKIDTEAGNKEGISTALTNIGYIYELQNNLPLALDNYMKSLKMDEKAESKEGIASSLNCIAGIYVKQKNYKTALLYGTRSFRVAKEVGYPTQIRDAARILSRIYQNQNDYKKAYEMYELHIQMRDSVNNEKNRRAGIKNQLQYEYEKKAVADSVKNMEEQKVKDAQIVAQESKLKQEKTQRYALYSGLILIAGFLFFVINRFRVTQKQKKIIEAQKDDVDLAYEKLHEKNKEVLDSIFYARRIQRALLPNEKYIEKYLRN